MAIEIHATTVTHDIDGDVVQLHISDAKPDDESASFVLTLLAKVRPFETPLLAHLQRAALKQASDVLQKMCQEMAADLKNFPLDAPPRGNKWDR